MLEEGSSVEQVKKSIEKFEELKKYALVLAQDKTAEGRIALLNLITEKWIGPVLSNFICVVWWVAIWEMVELQTIEKSDLKWRRLNFQQLYDANITFVFDEEQIESQRRKEIDEMLRTEGALDVISGNCNIKI